MSQKKKLMIGLGIIALCLLVALGGMIMNRSTSREATPEENAVFGAYDPGMTQQQILELCVFTEEAQIGQNHYRMFTSDSLPGKLSGCSELQRIALDEQENLYVQYVDGENRRTVTLAYAEEALAELAVFDATEDILYHRLGQTVEVWERFASGVQWG